MAELFGVSTDYLLKDEMNEEPLRHYSEGYSDAGAAGKESIRRVTMEEANTFLDRKRKSAPVIANATFMCIISPALLILLSTMAEDHVLFMTEKLASGAGLVFLFGMIAAAVFLFITCGMKDSRMEHLEKEVFETEYGVTGMVKERKSAYETVFTRGIAIGVVLCILAVVPLVIVGIMEAPDYVCGAFTALMLLLIAAGVNMIIRVSMIRGSYDTLLQEGEFTRAEKRAKRKLDTVYGAYWCLATAIYLGWSFWTMRWDLTWIVWPVAGVLFAAVSALLRLAVGAEE